MPEIRAYFRTAEIDACVCGDPDLCKKNRELFGVGIVLKENNEK